jgi:hypothetical protein
MFHNWNLTMAAKSGKAQSEPHNKASKLKYRQILIPGMNPVFPWHLSKLSMPTFLIKISRSGRTSHQRIKRLSLYEAGTLNWVLV